MTSHGAAGRIDDGWLLLEKGDYRGAEAAFREAVQLDHACHEAYQGLGWALLNLDRNLEAGAAFQSAIRLEPDVAGAHEGLGLVLSGEDRHAAAEAEYHEAVRLDPGSALARCRLGESLYSQGRYVEAEIAFRDAISADPGLAAARTWLGRALRELGESGAAEAEFRAAIRLEPGNVDARQDLAAMERDAAGLGHAGDDRITASERGEGRAGPQRGARVTIPPAVLRRSPRARPLRRFLAGSVDIFMIPAFSALLVPGLFGVAGVAAICAFNGYLEGKNGQSVGKMLTGLHTVHGQTGEFIGGRNGILRRLLHVMDYLTVVGFIIGLITGQTIADACMGTVVVWRPTWVKATSRGELAALERANYRRLSQRTGFLLLLLAAIFPKLPAAAGTAAATGASRSAAAGPGS